MTSISAEGLSIHCCKRTLPCGVQVLLSNAVVKLTSWLKVRRPELTEEGKALLIYACLDRGAENLQ